MRSQRATQPLLPLLNLTIMLEWKHCERMFHSCTEQPPQETQITLITVLQQLNDNSCQSIMQWAGLKAGVPQSKTHLSGCCLTAKEEMKSLRVLSACLEANIYSETIFFNNVGAASSGVITW